MADPDIGAASNSSIQWDLVAISEPSMNRVSTRPAASDRGHTPSC